MIQNREEIMALKNSLPPSSPTRRGRLILFAMALLAGPALAANSNLTWKADLTLKETYDDNVYLQDTAPGVPGAVPARKDSWVTTITPHLALADKVCSVFNVSLSYAPDIVTYHNAPSEDYFAHRAGVTLGGNADKLVWEQVNSFIYIDGNHLGPTFARPQDVPPIGGIPLRDRRDAFIYRGGFKLTYTLDRFFLRPVASAYVHDFKTLQQTLAAPLVYENYISRQDVNGGLDVGYDVGKKTFLILGYRYGRQDQYKLLGVDSPFHSAYHRILFGVEGSPVPWLKLAALGGPEIRTWADGTPAGFDRNRQLYWVDATATVLPDKNDTVTLLFRRFEQPAFSSQSVYEDITYSTTWKHKFNDHWAASAGFQLYIGHWQAPVNRDDWIYTPSAGLTYTYNKHLSAELSWSSDLVDNKTSTSAPGATFADGREYSRDLASLAVTCSY
jgi:hypothetical protein